AKTGQPDGTCAPIPAGTDPEAECTDDGAASCGQDGLCDGAGACEKYAGPGCVPLPCTLGVECSSGMCAKEPGQSSGICCNEACLDPCRSCLAVLQGPGGQDGVCGPILADTDPRDACVADPGFPASCGADGSCDGSGNCRAYALSSVACGNTTCV